MARFGPRRKFADRSEAAKENYRKFSRPQYKTVGDRMRGEGFLETGLGRKIRPTQMNDWTSGIMNPNLGNTAGRGRGTYTKTPRGSYKFSPVGITRRPTLPPEMYEHMVGQNTGLMNTGNLPAEMMLAELTPKQQEWMRSRAATPDFISPDYSYKAIQDMEDKGFFGFDAQEPTTRGEFDEYYNYLLANPSLTSWQT